MKSIIEVKTGDAERDALAASLRSIRLDGLHRLRGSRRGRDMTGVIINTIPMLWMTSSAASIGAAGIWTCPQRATEHRHHAS